jgi:peptidoglycan/xylan/chitin deacetylase (PgdA/CDA1 family)
VVVAAVLLWENLDVRQLAPAVATEPGPLPEPVPAVLPGVEPGSFAAAILVSPRNALFFPNPKHYPRDVRRWRELIESSGGQVREVESSEELGAVEPAEVLVLPEVPCLSDEELELVDDHLRAGGSLIANWAVGARDGNCEWRGWDTVKRLSGAGDVRELAVREALYFTVPGGTVLSPGLDPGSRIELHPEAVLALQIPGARVFWSDWALNPAPDESGGGADVAAAAQTTDYGGRVAWFGFHLSQAATPRDSLRLDRMVRNGILWTSGLVTANPAPWPHGRRAALLFVEDVEAEYQNARAMAGVLRDMGLPGSFFVVSQLVMDDPELADLLSQAGEIGSQTSDHTRVAGLTLQDQSVRLRRSWTEIRGWTGIPPSGLRPPEEEFDSNTLRAWQAAGGEYVLAVNQARSGSPEIHWIQGEAMVLLPRLLKDDYNVFVQEGAYRTARLTDAFLEGTDKLRALGGLAVVVVHTQIADTEERLGAIRAVADRARSQGDWWISRADEVAEWWKARASVRVTVLPRQEVSLDADSLPVPASSESPTGDVEALLPSPRYEILVEAPGDRSISGLWVDLVIPGEGESLATFVDEQPVPSASTEWGLRVPVGDLEPGEVRRVSLYPGAYQTLNVG